MLPYICYLNVYYLYLVTIGITMYICTCVCMYVDDVKIYCSFVAMYVHVIASQLRAEGSLVQTVVT